MPVQVYGHEFDLSYPSKFYTVAFLFLTLLFAAAESSAELSCRDIHWRRAVDQQRLESNSHALQSLKDESPERTRWILDQNRKANLLLKDSPNKKAVEDWLRDLYAKPKELKTVTLTDGGKIVLRKGGLGQPEELRLERDGDDSLLVSSAQLSRNQIYHIVEFKVSPNERYIALLTSDKGSTDLYHVIFYDLEKREIFNPPFQDQKYSFTTGEKKHIHWLGQTIYMSSNNIYYRYNLSDPSRIPTPINSWVRDSGQNILLSSVGPKYDLATRSELHRLPETGVPKSIVGQTDDSIFLKVESDGDTTEILRVALPLKGETVKSEKFIIFRHSAVTDVELKDEHFFVIDSRGSRQSLSVYNLKAEKIADLSAPLGTAIVRARFEEGRAALGVTLRSKVVNDMIFNYDLKSQKFEISEDAISSRMLTTKEHAFESFDVSTTSEDGMRIVLRITKLKDVQLNGNNPVYMHVYGGFGRLAGFYPEYRAVVAEFLARGGIVVDPTLRGGNEFGDSWHEEAKGKKKINTFNDLIAASRYLVDHGYTQARKIIIVGGSNGGLTVTGAALKSPQSFGLVISVNGVHDLLGKETLDPAFGAGWSYEYGDSREPEEFERLSELSPVERARNAKDLPQFLILNGRQDSRVHPAHSFKLYKALSESNPQAVRMVSLNNAGHWATDVDTQDLIAWRANVIIWTSIFDYLGWRK